MKTKKIAMGHTLEGFDGEDIDKNHWHKAPDGTLLAIKTNGQHNYQRDKVRKNIANASSLDIEPRWSPQRQDEWEQYQRELIARQKEYVRKLEESVQRHRDHISSLYDRMSKVRPGPRSSKITSDLYSKITSIENARMEKTEKLVKAQERLSKMQSETFRGRR